MAIASHCNTADRIGLAEYIDYIHTSVRLRDRDAVVASSAKLQALANNSDLVADIINAGVQTAFNDPRFQSAQTIAIAQGSGFYVRAAIWPSSADVASGRVFQNEFAFDLAHDHNYDLLTANHFGPGYATDIYEYDYDTVSGYVGESVDLRYLERRTLTQGTVLLYRANTDVHVQHPPKELTITINLMIHGEGLSTRDQYYFDVDRKEIIGYPDESKLSLQVSIVEIAATVGNADTYQLLSDLAHRHPSRRVRLKAFEALARLAPSGAFQVWEEAARDGEQLVSRVARQQLLNFNDV